MSDRLSLADRDWINEMLQYKDEDRTTIENLRTISTQREVTAENVTLLIDKMEEVNEKQKDLLVVYSQWYPVREEVIEKLSIVADKMDEYRFRSNCGVLVGSSVSLVGGGCMMVGFLCPPLLPVGLALAAGGSTISVASVLLEIGFSKRECDKIQYLLDEDKENTEKLIRALNGFNHINNELLKWIEKTPLTDEELRACAHAIKIRCGTTSLCSVVMSTCAFIKKCCDKHSDGSIVNLFTEISKDIGNAIDFSYIKGKMLSSTGLGMDDILGLCLGIAIKCIPVVSVIIDIMTIAKVLDDFKKGSKSEAAANMRTLAKQYREGKTDMKNIMNKVFPSRNN